MKIGSYLEAWQRVKKGCFETHFFRTLPTLNRLTSFKDNINKGQLYIDNETQLKDTETTEL